MNRFVPVLALAAIYFAAAWLSLALIAIAPGVIAAYWPPAGIALGALLVGGTRLWPAIPVASLAVSAVYRVPAATAALAATSASIEALAGIALFKRFASRNARLEHHREVFAYVFLCAVPSSGLGAALGSAGTGMAMPWWRADLLSLILFTPLILAWHEVFRRRREWSLGAHPARVAEFLAWMAACVFVSLLNFTRVLAIDARVFGGSYSLGILLIGWTLRFGMQAATLGSFLISLISVRGAYFGRGPFLRDLFAGEPLNLQVFLGLNSCAALLLASLVKERESALEQLSEAVRYRDQFISVASHELKTPLTSMILQIQLALESASHISGPKERMEKLLRMVEAQALRLQRLINDLLDVSKLLHRRVTIELEPYDLANLVHEEITRIEPQLKAAGSQVTRRIPGTVYGMWDRVRVGQIVGNLLSNAAKYGQGRPVEIGLRSTDRAILLWVRDQGRGISLADQKRIFERFERTATSLKTPGLGLGLYITRQIVEALGGRIWVISRPGRGSTFFVELPIREQARKATTA